MRRISPVCELVLLTLLLWVAASGPLLGGGPSSSAKATQAGVSARMAKLTASDGGANNELGYSVCSSGQTIVVGAPYATVAGRYAQGKVYIYQKPANGWADMRQTAELTASDGEENAFFGSSVSISGDTLVVGADGANIHSQMSQGAVYVFVKPASGWANITQTAKLAVPDGSAKLYFGSSVAITGDTVAIGADGASVGSNAFAGAVYVFVKPAKGWATASQPSAKLVASDESRDDQLGYSVSISGDTVIAGARAAMVGADSRQGAAYLFVKPAGGWKNNSELAKLTASDGARQGQFGSAVSIHDDVVVVGAPGRDSPGAVYAFVKPAAGWATTSTENAKLVASDGLKGDQLGHALAINGDTVLAGAPSSTVSASTHQGAVYVFAKPTNGWSGRIGESAKLTSSSGKPEDHFGSSVSLNGDTWVTGAPYTVIGSNKYQGTAYVIEKVASGGHAQSGTPALPK